MVTRIFLEEEKTKTYLCILSKQKNQKTNKKLDF